MLHPLNFMLCVHKDVFDVFAIKCAVCEKFGNMCLQKNLRAQQAAHVFAKEFACSTGLTPIVM